MTAGAILTSRGWGNIKFTSAGNEIILHLESRLMAFDGILMALLQSHCLVVSSSYYGVKPEVGALPVGELILQ